MQIEKHQNINSAAMEPVRRIKIINSDSEIIGKLRLPHVLTREELFKKWLRMDDSQNDLLEGEHPTQPDQNNLFEIQTLPQGGGIQIKPMDRNKKSFLFFFKQKDGQFKKLKSKTLEFGLAFEMRVKYAKRDFDFAISEKKMKRKARDGAGNISYSSLLRSIDFQNLLKEQKKLGRGIERKMQPCLEGMNMIRQRLKKSSRKATKNDVFSDEFQTTPFNQNFRNRKNQSGVITNFGLNDRNNLFVKKYSDGLAKSKQETENDNRRFFAEENEKFEMSENDLILEENNVKPKVKGVGDILRSNFKNPNNKAESEMDLSQIIDDYANENLNNLAFIEGKVDDDESCYETSNILEGIGSFRDNQEERSQATVLQTLNGNTQRELNRPSTVNDQSKSKSQNDQAGNRNTYSQRSLNTGRGTVIGGRRDHQRAHLSNIHDRAGNEGLDQEENEEQLIPGQRRRRRVFQADSDEEEEEKEDYNNQGILSSRYQQSWQSQQPQNYDQQAEIPTRNEMSVTTVSNTPIRNREPPLESAHSHHHPQQPCNRVEDLAASQKSNSTAKSSLSKIRVKKRLQKVLENEQQNVESDIKNQEIECCICFTNEMSQVGKLDCDHKFCFPCIENWSKVTNSCPLCKKVFNNIRKCDNQGFFLDDVICEDKKIDPDEIEYDAPVENAEDYCYSCNQTSSTELMLVCDHCSIKCCHIFCLQPALDEIPHEQWYCDYCVADHNIRFTLPIAGILDDLISTDMRNGNQQERSSIRRMSPIQNTRNLTQQENTLSETGRMELGVITNNLDQSERVRTRRQRNTRTRPNYQNEFEPPLRTDRELEQELGDFVVNDMPENTQEENYEEESFDNTMDSIVRAFRRQNRDNSSNAPDSDQDFRNLVVQEEGIRNTRRRVQYDDLDDEDEESEDIYEDEYRSSRRNTRRRRQPVRRRQNAQRRGAGSSRSNSRRPARNATNRGQAGRSRRRGRTTRNTGSRRHQNQQRLNNTPIQELEQAAQNEQGEFIFG